MAICPVCKKTLVSRFTTDQVCSERCYHKHYELLLSNLASAATELLLPLPDPGTDLAKVVMANKLLRQERDALKIELDKYVQRNAKWAELSESFGWWEPEEIRAAYDSLLNDQRQRGGEAAFADNLRVLAEQERDALKIRVEELEKSLVLIGERAVVDWDDHVVGEVDRVVKNPVRYRDWLKGVFSRLGTWHGGDGNTTK